jgi:hypothetical protein
MQQRAASAQASSDHAATAEGAVLAFAVVAVVAALLIWAGSQVSWLVLAPAVIAGTWVGIASLFSP